MKDKAPCLRKAVLRSQEYMRRERELDALKRLEQYHENLSDEDRVYLTERGFERREGLPALGKDRPQRPHFILSLKHAFEFRYRPSGGIGAFIIDPTKQSVGSLVGLIEESALEAKRHERLSYPNPPGQAFLLFVDDPKWNPVVEELCSRYNKE